MATNIQVEELLTKKQLAERLKLSCRSIDRKISLGEFPRGFKIGALVRWRRAVVEDWIMSNCPSNKGRAK